MSAILQNYNGNWICNYEYSYGRELNNVTEISPRQVAFVPIIHETTRTKSENKT